jgi:hypothetical protein
VQDSDNMVRIFMSSNNKKDVLQTGGSSKPSAIALGQDCATNSPASSSRSYRRIKELKNSINSKKHNSQQLNSTTNNNNNNNNHDEENLKRSLINSFTKRRERKGSLPEINTRTLVADDLEFNGGHHHCDNGTNPSLLNTASAIFGTVVNLNDDVDDNDEFCCHPLTSTQETFRQIPMLDEHQKKYQQYEQQAQNHYATSNKRNSRKSAFVLEVYRTSMFRSKSLTDLNSSLVKSENFGPNLTNNGNNLVQASFKNSTNFNANNTMPTTASSSNKFSLPMNEKYKY